MVMDSKGINTLFESKLEDALWSVRNEFAIIKSDLKYVPAQEIIHQNSATNLRFSDVVTNKTEPPVIIQPKNASQPPSKTKTDLMKHVPSIKTFNKHE